MSKKIRVAIVMGGGVSLGTFNGGALSRCIELLNDLNDKGDYQVEIDVLAGSSAGSLTLGLALHTLCHPDYGPGKIAERQHEAWVKEIDIQKLAVPPKDKVWRSLLNRQAVDDIAKNMMKWDVGLKPQKSLLADRVLFTVTLTNLNGLAYDAKAAVANNVKLIGPDAYSDPLTATLHKDPRTFEIHFENKKKLIKYCRHLSPTNLAKPETWIEIGGSCVASGCFPFAFEPVSLLRYQDEYEPTKVSMGWHPYRADNTSEPSETDPMLMQYVDGGVLDNEPLETALKHCRMLDHGGAAYNLGEDDLRLILYIDPFIDGHSPVTNLEMFANVTLQDGGKDMKDLGMLDRLLGHLSPNINAIRKQAINRHWIQDPSSLLKGYKSENCLMMGVGPMDTKNTPVPLAGTSLSGFAGFIDQNFREFDFKYGAWLAQDWMSQISHFVVEGPKKSQRPNPNTLPSKKVWTKRQGFKVLRQRSKDLAAIATDQAFLLVAGRSRLIRRWKIGELLTNSIEVPEPVESYRDVEVRVEIDNIPKLIRTNPRIRLALSKIGSHTLTGELKIFRQPRPYVLYTGFRYRFSSTLSKPTVESPHLNHSSNSQPNLSIQIRRINRNGTNSHKDKEKGFSFQNFHQLTVDAAQSYYPQRLVLSVDWENGTCNARLVNNHQPWR